MSCLFVFTVAFLSNLCVLPASVGSATHHWEPGMAWNSRDDRQCMKQGEDGLLFQNVSLSFLLYWPVFGSCYPKSLAKSEMPLDCICGHWRYASFIPAQMLRYLLLLASWFLKSLTDNFRGYLMLSDGQFWHCNIRLSYKTRTILPCALSPGLSLFLSMLSFRA